METRRRFALFFALTSLGFCWSSEEMVTFCISYGLAGFGAAGGQIYLYGVYLPVFCLFAVFFIAWKSSGAVIEKTSAIAGMAVSGVLGIMVFALFPGMPFAVIVGVILFAGSAIVLNYLAINFAFRAGGRFASRLLIVTALMTCVSTLLWQFPPEALYLISAVFLMLGFVGVVVARDFDEGSDSPLEPESMREGGARAMRACGNRPSTLLKRPAALVGVGVVSLCFGFLQYTAYHYSPGGAPSEFFSHVVAVVLVVLVIVVLKDLDQVLSMKIAVTLMLFAYVAFSVLHGNKDIAFVLAAGAEGMFELVLILVLVGLMGRRSIRPTLLFGSYALLIGISQLIGCVLSVFEHRILPTDSYSIVGLALVAMLIITAVWLLNDKTIAEFLWSGKEGVVEEAGRGESGDKIAEMAAAFRLTPREAEVLELLGRGRSSSFIAEHFCVSSNTVRSHILHIYNKIDVHTRQELISMIDEWPC